jgi:hypothetical protein
LGSGAGGSVGGGSAGEESSAVGLKRQKEVGGGVGGVGGGTAGGVDVGEIGMQEGKRLKSVSCLKSVSSRVDFVTEVP